MRLTSFLLASLLNLGACTADVRETKLADVDLTDMRTLQGLRQRLPADDGAALASFAVKHLSSSARFCGHALVRPDGFPPTTLGEAIDLTQAREAEQRRELAEGNTPLGPAELPRQRWDDLTSDRDGIIDAQSRLRTTYGEEAKKHTEWAALETSLSRIDRQLTELKPVVFEH